MTPQPLISFVVVTHDRPIELVENRIIRSIAQQDYPRLELVLMGEECQHMGELVAHLQKNFAGPTAEVDKRVAPTNGPEFSLEPSSPVPEPGSELSPG